MQSQKPETLHGEIAVLTPIRLSKMEGSIRMRRPRRRAELRG